MITENNQLSHPLKLGYWKLRGRAQVARLLLQFLEIPYQNIIFSNPQQWRQYKKENQALYPLLDLPFLIDGDIVITEAVPICNYVIKKSDRKELLGKNIRDFSNLNMYTWSMDNLGLALVKLCWMPGRLQKIEEVKDRFWQMNVKVQIERLQKFAGNKSWMLGYLSLFDFSIYELMHYIVIIFPKQIKDYRKLLEIERKVGDLPEVKAYEESKGRILQYLPSQKYEKGK